MGFFHGWFRVVLWGVAVGLLAGCEKVEEIRESFAHLTPHEQYAAALRTAGLAETELASQWLLASTTALRPDTPITLPFREARYLDPARPAAISYAMELRRGQELLIQVDTTPGDTSALFLDLYHVPADSTEPVRHLESADSTWAITYNVRRNGMYLLRAQPELLRGGRYTFTIQTDASLAFPVAGRDSRAIRSFFGDARDGGRRDHHGVDIFAPRGTPAVAAADGVITRVRNGGLGGKVVWLRDAYGQHLYYAHLDSQMVRPGMRVSVGDTVGLVGNTGNARTTPPHLHFGIYQRGPTDPFPFVHQPTEQPPEVRADDAVLGQWAQVRQPRTTLRAAPNQRTEAVHALDEGTAVYVEGNNGGWHRVVLPDGQTGYLTEAQLRHSPDVREERFEGPGQAIRIAPVANALPIDTLSRAAEVRVLGRFEEHQLVQTVAGRQGWVVPSK